ncbi:MAG: radical SAM family heme chaperone HemW [Deltaproteobacteria bacterium]|nr:radical SAM family heme chaperone HemW [Deltaproteobacteria bacterium]
MRTDAPGSPRGGPAGLYVHVPFCASKCPYCGFFSVAGTPPVEATRFVDALTREAALHRDRFGAFDTLYVGGGTPSVLPDDALARIAALGAGAAEATVEANPGDLDPGRLVRLRAAGFDRLSLGVQSLDDSDLRVLGRRHSAADAVRAFRDARAAGFANAGIDLIRGVPGQSSAAFIDVLDRAVALAPAHVSVYDLTVEEGTPFASRGVAPPCEDDAADLFLATSGRLVAAGYEHYEVSNFARGPTLRSRHNSRYWNRMPYLGVGPAAHSFDGARRWWNPRSVERWLAAVEAGRDPAEGGETLTPEQARLESLALGLRTLDGIDAALVGDPAALRRLHAGGLLEIVEGRVRPTVRGMLAADRLARDLA